MNQVVNNPQGASGIVEEIKHALINEFQMPKSKDQFMNEMIEVR
jgi:hypothetical protein